MCTTYAAALVAERLREVGGQVRRCCLVRLHPAVEYKTRGNAALAIHTDLEAAGTFELAREVVAEHAVTADPRTNPAVVVAPGDPLEVAESVADFSKRAVRDHLDPASARSLAAIAEYTADSWGTDRGLVGAMAAVGAWRAWAESPLEPTYERIIYRPPERWGTDREVDVESVFDAADRGYPTVWDTVDRGTGEAVCVPNTPGPVLFGVRGDDPDACRAVADGIDHEPAERAVTFVTNQGTDAHLHPASIAGAEPGGCYRLDGVVAEPPETRQGGHVFLTLREPRGHATIGAAAFAPTDRFRDRVRALRVGDRLTACGEVSDGTLKLEKFAARELVRTERVTPDCPDCGRSMSSAGRGQGYRCRDCGTDAPGKVDRDLQRELERGWYEVPPCARRHIAKPLVRGGFDATTHPER